MRGGGKKKQYTPKPKAWKEERSPPKSKASAPFEQNNSTESRGRGVREETHKHKPQRPAGTASPNHPSRQHLCIAWWGPGAEPNAGDMQQRPTEAESENPPSGRLGKTKPSRKMRHQQSQHIPTAHSHLLGESPCPPHSPWGSQGIRHHRTGTLPCWHKLKEGRAAVGKQHESTQGIRYLSGKGDESKKTQAPGRGVPRTSSGTGTSERL